MNKILTKKIKIKKIISYKKYKYLSTFTNVTVKFPQKNREVVTSLLVVIYTNIYKYTVRIKIYLLHIWLSFNLPVMVKFPWKKHGL